MITRESVLLTLGAVERMDPEELVPLLRQHMQPLLWVALTLELLLKYAWPLCAFDLPLGANPGIYRYLFLHYSQAWPPFTIPAMDPWAYQYPLGLFVVLLPLLKTGVPVDALLGWIWSLMPIVLALVLGFVVGRGSWKTRDRGLLTVVMALLSLGQWVMYERMEWTMAAALLFCVLAFALLERKSWWAVPAAIATVATDQQTGILFLLVLLCWWIHLFFSLSLKSRGQFFFSVTLGGLLFLGAALLYLPLLDTAVTLQLRSMSVELPRLPFFLWFSPVIWGLGIFGVTKTLRQKRITIWHLALFVAAFLALLQFSSHPRFLLFVDFFLLPFAASGLLLLWKRRRFLLRCGLITAVIVQALLTTVVATSATPRISADTLHSVVDAAAMLPADSLLLTLDPESAAWLQGWLPGRHIAGPTTTVSPWSEAEWDFFFHGSLNDRWALVQKLRGPVYFLITDGFRALHPDLAQTLHREPCFREVEGTPFLRVICTLPEGPVLKTRP